MNGVPAQETSTALEVTIEPSTFMYVAAIECLPAAAPHAQSTKPAAVDVGTTLSATDLVEVAAVVNPAVG